MSMGLGSNYNFGQFVCQIAIPRNTQYPTLSVRFKESGSWGSWTGLTANNLNMRTNIWHNSDDNYNRFYFQPNGRTYFRGYGTPTTADNAFEFMNAAGSVILGINDNGNAYFTNQITCKFYTIPSSNTDYIGVNANTGSGSNGNYTMYVLFGTFTGMHRSFFR